MSAGESRFVAEALLAMRQSFFSLAILASIFPGPALAQFKSWSKEQRTFERFSGALVSALHGPPRCRPRAKGDDERAGVRLTTVRRQTKLPGVLGTRCARGILTWRPTTIEAYLDPCVA